ncbi:MAG TPA: GntR family transcriptional regulator [Gemmatimonadaceae bacterium]|nr:GntR family transcriptional regulator [Gemmatimonadaceae bacterium]
MTASAALRVERPAQVYERLRTLIIRGRIAPGTRVVEKDIADRLGVSRTPAREALLRLFQEGFLIATDTSRRVELAVAPLTREDLVDLYRIMGALEASASRGIEILSEAERRELVRDLRDLEGRFESAARERKIDFDKMFDSHNAFHERLMDACAAPRHRALLDTVRPQVERYEWVYAPLVGPDYSATFAEHDAIIKAVRDGGPKGISRAVAANWDLGASRLSEVIGQAGARGDWMD